MFTFQIRQMFIHLCGLTRFFFVDINSDNTKGTSSSVKRHKCAVTVKLKIVSINTFRISAIHEAIYLKISTTIYITPLHAIKLRCH